MSLAASLLAAALGAGCSEKPIWASDPVPLLRAVADNRPSLVIEWAESGTDLSLPLPVADANLPRAWTAGLAARPLDVAVEYGRREVALLLLQLGADVGAAAQPLACLVAAGGSLDEMKILQARAPIETSTYCSRESSTLVALARRNGRGMESLITGVAATPQ